MNHWIWLASLVGILSTAVVCGTDTFFLTIGRPALKLASPSAGTEVMRFLHTLRACRSRASRRSCATSCWSCYSGVDSAGSISHRC